MSGHADPSNGIVGAGAAQTSDESSQLAPGRRDLSAVGNTLTRTERRIFARLVKSADGADINELVRCVWGAGSLKDEDITQASHHALRVNFSRMRVKLRPAGYNIVSRKQRGMFRLEPCAPDVSAEQAESGMVGGQYEPSSTAWREPQ